MTTLLAQLTDPHIREPGRLAYGRTDTAPYLRCGVDAILRLAFIGDFGSLHPFHKNGSLID